MQNPVNVISLKHKHDFLIHRGCFAESRVSGQIVPDRADVSRETFLRKLRAGGAANFLPAQ
jgi:hypothetical protein